MKPRKIKLTDEHRQLLNAKLKDLADIKNDAEVAHKAGVPSMESVIERCNCATDRIKSMKAAYFPNKP